MRLEIQRVCLTFSNYGHCFDRKRFHDFYPGERKLNRLRPLSLNSNMNISAWFYKFGILLVKNIKNYYRKVNSK